MLRNASWLFVILFSLFSTQAATSQDPVTLAPNNYKMLLDNDRVRVLEARVKPGQRTPMHSHPARVVYSFNSYKTRFSFPDGRSVESKSSAGEARWREAVTHSEENIGNTDSHALIIELKEPQRSASALPELLPPERERELALSAAPPHLRDGATVYVLEAGGYVKVREGTNGFTCLLVRDHPQDLAPICHDPEGTKTVVPRLLREAELRAQGKSEGEIRAEINEHLSTGKYRVPQRVGIAYMLSTEAKAFVPELGRTQILKPHVMLYSPHLRNEDIGALSPRPDEFPDYPFVISEGEFNAYIVMAVPDADSPVPSVTPDPVLDRLTVQSESDLPPLLPREREIALALSAAPPHVAEKAAVYVLQRGGYVKVREGANGFSCLVGRGHPLSLHPICWDPEGTQTMLPVALRAAELREQGKSRDEIRREVAEDFRKGQFRAPRRAGLAYMLSKEGRFEGPNKQMTGWAPHVMFYAPYVRKEDVGAIEEGQMVRQLPTILSGGPHGYIVVTLRSGKMKETCNEDKICRNHAVVFTASK